MDVVVFDDARDESEHAGDERERPVAHPASPLNCEQAKQREEECECSPIGGVAEWQESSQRQRAIIFRLHGSQSRGVARDDNSKCVTVPLKERMRASILSNGAPGHCA